VLVDAYITEIKSIRDRATKIASLAPASESFKERTAAAHKILQLK